MNVDLWVEWKLCDDKNVVLKQKRFKGKSFVANFALMIYALMRYAGDDTTISINDVGAVGYNFPDLIAASGKFGYCLAGAGVQTFGIVISDTAATSMADIRLDAISNKNTTLTYGDTTMDASVTVNSTTDKATFKIYRTFTNSTGSGVDVYDIALYGEYYDGSIDNMFFNLCVDHLNAGSAVSIPDGQHIDVSLEIQVSA